ncbi:MAG: hypothetical protein ACMXYG_07410 [Candidatus Woesearchaeota archaeon]
MQLKLRQINSDGETRNEVRSEIKEIIINEDILHPESESISICFRGKNSSGIIDISPEEFDALSRAVKKRLHLIKGISKI